VYLQKISHINSTLPRKNTEENRNIMKYRLKATQRIWKYQCCHWTET
jgi:hypothetical protein